MTPLKDKHPKACTLRELHVLGNFTFYTPLPKEGTEQERRALLKAMFDAHLDRFFKKPAWLVDRRNEAHEKNY